MNPAWLIANWKLGIFLAVTAVAALQTYRLQGAQAEVALYQERERAQLEAQARAALHNQRNKERTDEEYAAAQRRARLARVRAHATTLVASASAAAAGGADPVACFDRGQLNVELAGVMERTAERLSRLASEGEGVAAAYRACRSWALSLENAPGTGGAGAVGGSADQPVPGPR